MKDAVRMLSKGLLVCSLVAAVTACSQEAAETRTPEAVDEADSAAFSEPETTSLGRAAASIATGHGGESGFLVLDRGHDALSWRTLLADAAGKSIDAQYFLRKDDDAGKIMVQRCSTQPIGACASGS